MPWRIIQSHLALTETPSCLKLLACSKVRNQQLRLSQPWVVEEETLKLLTTSGGAQQDVPT